MKVLTSYFKPDVSFGSQVALLACNAIDASWDFYIRDPRINQLIRTSPIPRLPSEVFERTR